MRHQMLVRHIGQRLFRITACLLLAGTTVSASMAASAACQIQAMAYDYPEQRLDQALQQFAHTSGCPVEVDTSQLGDRQAPALQGKFTPDAALIQLVRGSGLEVHLDDGHYRVNQSDRERINDRIETLRYRIESARDSDQLTQNDARTLDTQLEAIRTQSDQLITEQGFLSAAEMASYERLFAWLEGRLAPSSL
ncbi:hypothetical protein SAMN05421848_1625 [Kushneria avicenniae]|uniref:Secretin/TonB short N-terminal domain-containing protein n=1 Tax=Kushneria avicenniae TaxID=402385 RepID=A0A1I1JLA8_9GAMM|nr:STN domain-containing protein [Kushneria avicenniae]SFC49135.1 hypothetical protein SAMN05421848_1625 [Kushneria avicenniae]